MYLLGQGPGSRVLAKWKRNTRISSDTSSPKKSLILEAKLPRYWDIMAGIVSDHLKIIMNCFPV